MRRVAAAAQRRTETERQRGRRLPAVSPAETERRRGGGAVLYRRCISQRPMVVTGHALADITTDVGGALDDTVL